MKNLLPATALSLAALLSAQACCAEESAAFVARQQAYQQHSHSTSTQPASTQNTAQRG